MACNSFISVLPVFMEAAWSIITNLSDQLSQADAEERSKHRWFANGKALSDFNPEEFQATKEAVLMSFSGGNAELQTYDM
ncbi:unnamed protein product [Symbiodinium pilosum]|uniref:Uncharacterized protein n=1 Tax=Symbiodinium pilosum TaxID=2952 RepID=A0A812YEP0_SYMPI|nr:unnamed protein product [Symbiodinium pilosum]